MRLLQSTLFVFGASALGLVSCVVLAIFVVAAMETSGSGEDWGSAMIAAYLAFFGGLFGAIAGFVGSLRWILQREYELWTATTWIGILSGLVFVLVVRFSGSLNFCVLGMLIKSWLGLALFVAAAACVGGFAGGAAGASRKAGR
jgi:hypothetical protein